MSSTAVVRAGMDASVRRENPSGHYNHPFSRTLALRNGDAECQAFIYFKNPVPRGGKVLTATLRFRAYGNSAGFKNLLVRRVMAPWSASKVTWNTRPDSSGGNLETVYVGSVSHGDYIDVPVDTDVQAWANGAPNYGWRLETDTSDVWRIAGLGYADYGRPVLIVTWALPPAKPTGLAPNGSVSLTEPVVQYDYHPGKANLAGTEIEISTTLGGSGTTYYRPGPRPEIALSALSDFAGLSPDQTLYYRVRALDADGLWSPWSDKARLTRVDKSDVAITLPAVAPSNVVWDTSPVVAWEFTPSTSALFSASQVAWQVIVAPTATPSRPVYDSGKRAGGDLDHELPLNALRDDTSYNLTVRVWDDRTDRATSPGDPIYSQATRTFTVDDDLIVLGPSSLTATQDGKAPSVLLQWERSAAPDAFSILRDGVVIETVEAVDALVSGTTYAYRDVRPQPKATHVYTVKAVTDKHQSTPSPEATVKLDVEGIWIVDPEDGTSVMLWGNEAGSWDSPDSADVYTPVGSSRVVRIVSGMRGLEGSIQGSLMEGFGASFEEHLAAIYTIKSRPRRTFRLVLGDVNIPAVIGNIVVSPDQRYRDGQPVRSVSLDFWQDGELPYTYER